MSTLAIRFPRLQTRSPECACEVDQRHQTDGRNGHSCSGPLRHPHALGNTHDPGQSEACPSAARQSPIRLNDAAHVIHWVRNATDTYPKWISSLNRRRPTMRTSLPGDARRTIACQIVDPLSSCGTGAQSHGYSTRTAAPDQCAGQGKDTRTTATTTFPLSNPPNRCFQCTAVGQIAAWPSELQRHADECR